MKKGEKSKSDAVIVNRRARFDYVLSDELTTGIVLKGPEVRAARDGRVHLKGAFVTIRNDELWLNNASFSLKLNQPNSDSQIAVDTTPRKLLATKKQIAGIFLKKKAGLSIVPTRMFVHGKHIKLEIAIGKGKKEYDKRQVIKKRDAERTSRRVIG